MTKTQIEMRAVEIIDRAIAMQHVEDSHIELKSEWPNVSTFAEARKTARQIAGHANAARGEPILWLIGVDEKAGKVTGADPQELSNWFAAVKAEFDRVIPSFIDVNVHHEKGTVVALYFDTDQAPFVVRNPVHGTGGPAEFEVPWREGRSTRSATRLDLLRVLTPVQRLPELEVLGCELSVMLNQTPPSPPAGMIWSLRVDYFVATAASNSQVVLPAHNCEVAISFNGVNFPDYHYHSIAFGMSGYPQASLVQASDAQVIINGPGRFHLDVMRHSKVLAMLGWQDSTAKVAITFRPANSDRSIKQEISLRPGPRRNEPHRLAYWILDSMPS